MSAVHENEEKGIKGKAKEKKGKKRRLIQENGRIVAQLL